MRNRQRRGLVATMEGSTAKTVAVVTPESMDTLLAELDHAELEVSQSDDVVITMEENIDTVKFEAEALDELHGVLAATLENDGKGPSQDVVKVVGLGVSRSCDILGIDAEHIMPSLENFDDNVKVTTEAAMDNIKAAVSRALKAAQKGMVKVYEMVMGFITKIMMMAMSAGKVVGALQSRVDEVSTLTSKETSFKSKGLANVFSVGKKMMSVKLMLKSYEQHIELAKLQSKMSDTLSELVTAATDLTADIDKKDKTDDEKAKFAEDILALTAKVINIAKAKDASGEVIALVGKGYASDNFDLRSVSGFVSGQSLVIGLPKEAKYANASSLIGFVQIVKSDEKVGSEMIPVMSSKEINTLHGYLGTLATTMDNNKKVAKNLKTSKKALSSALKKLMKAMPDDNAVLLTSITQAKDIVVKAGNFNKDLNYKVTKLTTGSLKAGIALLRAQLAQYPTPKKAKKDKK